MGEFSAWHLLIVAAVFVLLFGAKRLPDAARSLGRSLRIFKAETKGLREDAPREDADPPRSLEGPGRSVAEPPAAPTAASVPPPAPAPARNDAAERR